MRVARSIAKAAVAAAAVGAAAVGAHAGPAPADAFDRAFATRGEPVSLRYEVSYEDAQGTHRLSVWRDGQDRLRRRTDATLDLLVERGADDELLMNVVDHRRHIVTAVSRTALYRVGHGLDWFSLAHGLARPATAFTVSRTGRAPTLAAADAPIAVCRWHTLAEGERRSDVCWSAALGLPLTIVAQPSGRVVWRVTQARAQRPDAADFIVPAPGYVRVDADDDLRAD